VTEGEAARHADRRGELDLAASEGDIVRWLQTRWQPAPPELETSERLAHRRLAEAVRSLVSETIATGADAATLTAAAATVEGIATMFSTQPRGMLHPLDPNPAVPHDPHVWSEWSAVMGMSHPLAPPLHIRREGDVAVATATYGAQYEGPPGCLHGGFIAAAFDDVLGAAQTLSERAGHTGTLSIRYAAPTPLEVEVRYEGRMDAIEGRKLRCSGTLHHGKILCAEAEALFIIPEGWV